MTKELKPGEYIGEDFREVWCKAMADWYAGLCNGEQPSWQYIMDSDGAFEEFEAAFCHNPTFNSVFRYRLTPPPKRTTVIDGKTYVLAEKVAPRRGTKYFYIFAYGVDTCAWNDDGTDKEMLAANNVFLTKEDAQAWLDLGVKQRGGM